MPAFEDFCYLVPLLELSYPVYQALVWAANHCEDVRLRQKKFLALLIQTYGFEWQFTNYAHPDRSISTQSIFKIEAPLVSLAETHRNNGTMVLSLYPSKNQTELLWRTWEKDNEIDESQIFLEVKAFNTTENSSISSYRFFSLLDQSLPDPIYKE